MLHFNQNLKNQNWEFLWLVCVAHNRHFIFYEYIKEVALYLIFQLNHENWNTSSGFSKVCKQKQERGELRFEGAGQAARCLGAVAVGLVGNHQSNLISIALWAQEDSPYTLHFKNNKKKKELSPEEMSLISGFTNTWRPQAIRKI